MPALPMTFVAGAYSVAIDSDSLGVTEVGFECVMRPSMVPLRADVTGRTPLDAIWTGVEDVIVRMEGLEWDSTKWPLAVPWLHFGAVEGAVMPSGTLLNATAQTYGPLILTPITGNASSSLGAHYYNFAAAYPLEPVRSVFSAQRLRTISYGFYCFASGVSIGATGGISTVYTMEDIV